MGEELESGFLSSMDRRITDHDQKLTAVQRDYTEVSHEIKELLNRINNGLSPSVNKVKDDNAEIKGQLKDLKHDLSDGLKDMRGMVRESAELTRSMLENFEKGQLQPLAMDVGFIKKTFIYGVVGALVVFLGQRGLNVIWDRIFKPPISAPAAP